MAKLFDESEFLSPHGLRALSAYHREHPYEIDVEGVQATIDYEPAESTTPMFGGNSNWRGPVWFPLNYLVISVLERYHRFFGDDLTIEYPAGSGSQLTLDAVAADLQDRLISIFTRARTDGGPASAGSSGCRQDPAWQDNLVFSEYFHGDNGAALGASHQTGWTGLIADVIRRRHGEVRASATSSGGWDGHTEMTATEARPPGCCPEAASRWVRRSSGPERDRRVRPGGAWIPGQQPGRAERRGLRGQRAAQPGGGR